MELKNEEISESLIYRYRPPAVSAYSAFLFAKSYYVFVPYWVFLFLVYLVKDRVLYKGVNAADWVFLILWVPFQIGFLYFGKRMIKKILIQNFWPWVISAILSLFIDIYFVTISSTVLYL